MNNNYCATAISVDFINKKVYVEFCSFESIDNIKKAIVAYGDNPNDYEVTHEKPVPKLIDLTNDNGNNKAFEDWFKKQKITPFNQPRYDKIGGKKSTEVLENIGKLLNDYPNDSKY